MPPSYSGLPPLRAGALGRGRRQRRRASGHAACVDPRRCRSAAGRVCPIQAILRSLHERFQPLAAGRVATYIPELAAADPSWFGICLATADGHVYEVGDTRVSRSRSSRSRSRSSTASRSRTAARRRCWRGSASSRRATRSTRSASSRAPGRPLNPMINAGAIAATSLVAGHSVEDRWARILALFSLYAGRRARARRDGLSLGARHRPPQPRDRPHAAQLRHHRARSRSRTSTSTSGSARSRSTCRDLAIMAPRSRPAASNPVTGERVLRSVARATRC